MAQRQEPGEVPFMARHPLYTRMIFFQLFKRFLLFFCKKRNSDNCRTQSEQVKNDIFERSCKWCQLFSLIFKYFIVYPKSSLYIQVIYHTLIMMLKIKQSFIDSDLLCRGALYRK